MEEQRHRKEQKTRREHIKTGAIIVLVFFAVYMGVLIFQSQLLKDKENFSLLIWKNMDRIASSSAALTDNDTRAAEMVVAFSRPRFYAVTREDGSRDVANEKSELYEELQPEVQDLLGKLYRGEAEPVTVEIMQDRGKWLRSLQTTSVYAKTPYTIQTGVYARMLGLEGSAVCSSLQSYEEMSVSAEGGKVVFYFPDTASGSVVSFHTALDASALSESIDEAAQIVAKNYVFAFETDKSEEDTPEQMPLSANVTLADTILIPAVTLSTPTITAASPEGMQSQEFIQKVMSLFAYKSTEVRQYTDSNGVEVFVSAGSTLKIHPDGFVEYRANDAEHGISLPGEEETDRSGAKYRAMLGVTRMILRLSDFVGIEIEGAPYSLLVTELSGGNTAEENIQIRMDYSFEGNRIDFSDAVGESRSAISAVVSNGSLTQLSCYLKEFAAAEPGSMLSGAAERTPNESLFNAIERGKQSADEWIQVEDAYLYYPVPYGSTQAHTAWKIITK